MSRATTRNHHDGARRLAALACLVVLAGLVVALGRTAPPAAAAPPPGGMAAPQVAEMFRVYGDAGGHWTGGDGTVSVLLPDGRVAWLFSDTFLGTVNADGSRPRSSPMVNNTLVVQDAATLVDTRHGGTAMWPEALVRPHQGGEFFWVADAVVESGALKVLYNRYARYGDGSLEVALRGTSLVTFALPGLTVSSVVDLPVGSAVTWGSALLVDGGYTYVYGSSPAPGGVRFGHVARAQVGSLGGAWQFWTGSAWSSQESAAGRLLSGAAPSYAVQKVDGQYVLVTQETNLVFDPQFVAYTSPSPTGPFSGPTYLYTAPEQQPGTQRIVYIARLHPELARPGKLLMSYDVNSLQEEDNYADARLYRPRFVEIDWPRPAPGPTPAAPGGFTVAGDSAGVANLRWNAVNGATGYRIWRRDVTGGQTHFVRQPYPVTSTATAVTGLITGHRYEFKVTAQNATGESPFTPTVPVTVRAVRDASVVELANTPDAIAGSYMVRLKETPHVRGSGVDVFARDLVTQAGGQLRHVYDSGIVGFSAALTEAQAIDLAGHPDVLTVEQDQQVSGDAVQLSPPSWGQDRIDQETLPLDTRYRYPNTGAGVNVYVVDSGVNTSHLAFGGRARSGWNFVDPPLPGQTVPPPATDCHGHGTHVAGTIGGSNTGSRDVGVAKGVNLIAVKVLGCDNTGHSDWVRRAISWVITDVASRSTAAPSVMNLSVSTPRSTTINALISRATEAGITVVAGAGNGNVDARYRSPAGSPEAITVAATNEADQRVVVNGSSGSNFGPAVDVFAPGLNILSAAHNAVDGYVLKHGTSMSAPHVTGVVAMTLAAHPGYTPADIERAIVEAATPGVVGDPGTGTPNRLLYVPEPPTQTPTGLSATANPDGTVGLSWSPLGQRGTHYLVSQRNVTAGEATFTRWSRPIFGTTATARDLRQGDRYEFRVAAANLAGTGPESAPVSAVSHTTPPPAPTGVTATPRPDGSVTLRWTAPAPHLMYWVYQRDVTIAGPSVKLPLPVVVCCEMTATMLVHDHQYEFQITAANAGGEGPPSTPVSARAQYPPAAAPTGLTATAGDGQAVLRWNPSTTPNAWYTVYQRNVTRAQPWVELPLPITTCCTMTAQFLSNGDQYEFEVTAVAGGPKSPPSNRVSVTPQQPVPGKVTGLTVTPNADGTLTLRWTQPTGGPFWFDVYQRDVTANQQSFTLLPLPVTSCCEMIATSLAHNNVYEYKVAATNGLFGPASDPVRATARQQIPGAPTGLRGSTSGDGHIDLTWNPPGTGSFVYWVYQRDVTAGQAGFTRLGLPAGTNGARLGPLLHDHTYEYKVTAANQAGEGAASAPVQITARGGLPAPATNLTATAGDGRVTLRWGATPTAGAWYWLERREAGGAWQRSRYPINDCCTHTVTSLLNGRTYEFRLFAYNASGDSAPTAPASARPMPPLPQPPTGLTAAAGDGVVNLRWTASATGNVWYWLEVRANGGAWQRGRYPISTCCTHAVPGLANGTNYDFRLVAYNLTGDSAPSTIASARPMPPRPQPPTNLTATAGDRVVHLRWTASTTPNVWYWLEVRANGGAWQRSAYPISTCCTFTVQFLDNGSWYDFRLVANTIAGDSAPSNSAGARPAQPPGTCHAVAFEPYMISYFVEASVLNVGGRAYASCVGPVSNVVVTATLFPAYDAPPDDSAVERWGTIATSRWGVVQTTYGAFALSHHCRPFVMRSMVTWTTPDGRPHTFMHYSPVTGVGPNCVPA